MGTLQVYCHKAHSKSNIHITHLLFNIIVYNCTNTSISSMINMFIYPNTLSLNILTKVVDRNLKYGFSISVLTLTLLLEGIKSSWPLLVKLSLKSYSLFWIKILTQIQFKCKSNWLREYNSQISQVKLVSSMYFEKWYVFMFTLDGHCKRVCYNIYNIFYLLNPYK